MTNPLTDIEKQKLVATFYLNKVHAPGLDELAFRIVDSISDVKERTAAFLTLSYYLAEFGNVRLAEDVARRHLHGYPKISALIALGCSLRKEDAGHALSYFREAEGQLKEIKDSDERAILLVQFARAYLRLGDWERATEFANQISSMGDRVATLCEVAGALWAANELSGAKQVLAGAHELANEVPIDERTGALNDVAKALMQVGREQEASELWEKAITFANSSNESAKWLYSVCENLLSAGKRERAREVAMLITNEARRNQALSRVDKK